MVEGCVALSMMLAAPVPILGAPPVVPQGPRQYALALRGPRGPAIEFSNPGGPQYPPFRERQVRPKGVAQDRKPVRVLGRRRRARAPIKS